MLFWDHGPREGGLLLGQGSAGESVLCSGGPGSDLCQPAVAPSGLSKAFHQHAKAQRFVYLDE